MDLTKLKKGNELEKKIKESQYLLEMTNKYKNEKEVFVSGIISDSKYTNISRNKEEIVNVFYDSFRSYLEKKVTALIKEFEEL